MLLSRRINLSTILFSLALSVKMNILLFAPGFALVYWQVIGLIDSIKQAALFILVQVFINN
jgi:alpha-1,3-mannosyltransferase